jgi:hypothetical protein
MHQRAREWFRTLWEIVGVLRCVPRVEFYRRRSSVFRAVTAVRERASRRRVRSMEQRPSLRRAIAIVDARLPGGPNCVRRSLLEMALDRRAADEKLLLGFRAGGGAKSGHAWLQSQESQDQYDAVITI